LSVALTNNSHPGYPYDQTLHAWVACGSSLVAAADPSYTWYQVASCANGNTQSSSAIPGCEAKVVQDPAKVAKVKACVSDSQLSSRLVEAMHALAASAHEFPAVSVNGNSSAVPEPDQHGDDAQPLIEAICAASPQAQLPPACAGARS
jgi:hypothetical protein